MPGIHDLPHPHEQPLSQSGLLRCAWQPDRLTGDIFAAGGTAVAQLEQREQGDA
jgi:hypothetical protein